MNRILYVTENKLKQLSEGNEKELTLQKIKKYRETLREINKRNEWKRSGSGARFMGEMSPIDSEDTAINAHISGITKYKDGIVYSVLLDDVGGLYIKSLDADDETESMILSSQKMYIGGLSCKDDKLAVSMGSSGTDKHISIFNLPGSKYIELTDGDTIEESPAFSRNKNELYFTTAGYARDPQGRIAAVSPRMISAYNFDTETMKELLSFDSFDCLKPKDDEYGNIYYIKRPYNEKASDTDILLDILLFPVRLVKAIGGFLNFFSMAFGGESLRSSGKNSSKAKQKSEKDIFIEGNTINAEKALKQNMSKGEKYPGIIPKSWELIKRGTDGNETCIKSGVLDYDICSDGNIIYSNGHNIIRISKNGEEELVGKAKLASFLINIE